MQFTDRVYGKVDITEPVLVALIESPTLQRLKHIDQAGYFEPYAPGSQYSRFEHSVGVCALLGRYGAPLEEQVAGLLHDVSHSAFSHCIDYVLNQGSEHAQDHQDNIHDSYVRESDIPAIVDAHAIDLEYVLNDAHFPLKERALPDLCADRIDYSLRSARACGEIASAADILDTLTTRDSTWVFSDASSARRYAELFSTVNRRYYAGFASACMFRTVSDYLAHALRHGYISQDDLYTTDKEVLTRIRDHHAQDEALRTLFERMNSPRHMVPANNPREADAEVVCKSRVVDPLFLDGDAVVRLSDHDPEWRHAVEHERAPVRHLIRFVD